MDLYEILTEILSTDKSKAIRDKILENKLFDRILDKIAVVGKEKKRKLIDKDPAQVEKELNEDANQ